MIVQHALNCAICGAALFAVGAAFHIATPWLFPQHAHAYANAELFRPWNGWTSSFMLVYPWCFAILLTGLFALAQIRFGAQHFGGPSDGLIYGGALFLVGSLPIFALNLASYAVPPSILATWVVQNLCQMATAGAVLGWCYPRGV